MIKITKIAGIDSKFGRKSRTGSNISIEVDDITALEAQQYLMSLEKGEEPTGNIRRIELVVYSQDDKDHLDTIESLENQIKELTDCLDDKPVPEMVETEKEHLPANQLELKFKEEK